MGKRSSPRGGDDSRGRSASRRSSGEQGGKKEQGSMSLLVRNIPHDCRKDLVAAFGKFGPIRDLYIPKDYYSGEPRGFAFIEFSESRDASEAQRRMHHTMLCGREINVVPAAAKRKRPDDMRRRTGVGPHSDCKGRHLSRLGRSRSRSHSRSPRHSGCDRSWSRSPAPRRRGDYSASPKRKEECQAKLSGHLKEHDKGKKQGRCTRDRSDHHDADNGSNKQDEYSTSPKRKEGKSPRLSKEHDTDKKRRSNSGDDGNDCCDADISLKERRATIDGEGSCPRNRSPSRKRADYSASPKGKEDQGQSPIHSKEYDKCKKRRSDTSDNRNNHPDADRSHNEMQGDHTTSPKIKEECQAKSSGESKEYDKDTERRSYAPHDRNDRHDADNGSKDSNVHVDRKLETPDGEGSHADRRSPGPSSRSSSRKQDDYSASEERKEELHANSPKQSNEHADKNRRSYTPDDRNDRCDADNCNNKKRDNYSASPKRKEECWVIQQTKEREVKKRSYAPDDRIVRHEAENCYNERRASPENGSPKRMEEPHQAKSQSQSNEDDNDKKQRSYTHDNRKDLCNADNISRERNDYSASGNRKEERGANFPRQSKERNEIKKRGSLTPDDRNDHHDSDNGSKERDDNSASRKRIEDHHVKSPRQSKEHENDKKRAAYTRDDRKDRCDADNGSRERDDNSASRKRMEDHRAKSPRQSKEHENDKKRGSYTRDDRNDRGDADNGSRGRDDNSASRKRMEDHHAKPPRQSKEHENDKKRGSYTRDGRKDHSDADNGSRSRDDYSASRKRKEECQGESPRLDGANKKRGSYAPDDRDDRHDAHNGCNEKLATHDRDRSHPSPRRRSPRPSSGSCSRSADKTRARRRD